MVGIMIRYNRRTGDRIVREYLGENGYKDAVRNRLFLRNASISSSADDLETVVIGADSLATVKRTHSRYFSGRDITSAVADVAEH